jgi:hypothetical protein
MKNTFLVGRLMIQYSLFILFCSYSAKSQGFLNWFNANSVGYDTVAHTWNVIATDASYYWLDTGFVEYFSFTIDNQTAYTISAMDALVTFKDQNNRVFFKKRIRMTCDPLNSGEVGNTHNWYFKPQILKSKFTGKWDYNMEVLKIYTVP